MPESLLTWFNRFTDDPKKLEGRLAGRPVLLYEPPETPPPALGDEEDDYQFRTQSGISVPAIGGGEPLAVVVEKTKDNAFQRRVTVGRTSNNDIVLDDNSVSRFHAWLQADDTGPGWSIVDAGSRNGTWVAGKKLNAKTPANLSSGVKVRVGVIELTFFSADGFYKMLKARAV